MSEVEFISAWQQSSDRVREDAIALWAELNILPQEVPVETRADQLLYGGYIDGELACIATANVLPYPQIQQKFAATRYLTAPAFRDHDLFTEGALYGHAWLGDWARDNPDEGLAGSMWTWNPQENTYYGRAAPPYWPPRPEPQSGAKPAILTGHTSDGTGIWTWWFDHIKV